MNNTVIGETYVIPSKARIYDYDFDPHVSLKSMTTTHEMKRLTRSEYPYKNLCEIIDDCIVSELPMSTYDMCIGDFQYLLYMLRVTTYGPDYTLESRCGYCGSVNTYTININDLPVKYYSEDLDEYKEFELPITKKRVRLKHQTPRMMDSVNEQSKEYNRRSKGQQPDSSLVFTIMAIIDTVDGKRVEPIKLEQWVRDLPMMDANTILKNSEFLTDSIGVEVVMSHVCDICGLEYEHTFRTTQEFFRPDIH